jgi:phospholipase/carboxylesterase
MEQGQTVEYRGWNLKIRKPAGEGPWNVLLMLHGLKGDENVMWIFAPRLPAGALIVAPRALYPAEGGGFTWQEHLSQGWAGLDSLRPAVERLHSLLDDLQNEPPDLWQPQQADFSQVDLLGFSQGSALSYAFTWLYPQRVRKLAALAGFMPAGVETLAQREPLVGRRIFVAHGSKDETVPLHKAQESARILEQAGAEVSLCVDDVGHKISLDCFKGLGQYFQS